MASPAHWLPHQTSREDAMPGKNETLHPIPPLIQEKLAAFDRIEPAFRGGFAYVEQMHGQRRFEAVSVADVVRYLSALWVCDRKDALLSVPVAIPRYDRRCALDLLLGWQKARTADVVQFLERKLDLQTFAQLAREIEAARAAGDTPLGGRLRHGWGILLNRAFNLHHALDAIFALSGDDLLVEVRRACAELGHSPDEIHEQRALLDTPAYSYVPHPELARRNMLVMNAIGVQITENAADRPGERTARVAAPAPPLPAYADAPLPHALEFTPPPLSTLGFYPAYSLLPPPPSREHALDPAGR